MRATSTSRAPPRAPRARRASSAIARRGRRATRARASSANGDDESTRKDSKSSSDEANEPAWARAGRDGANGRPIWEMDIDAEFDRVERARREREMKSEARANAGLGFGRARMLDDLNVDLSAALRKREDEDDEEDDEEDEDDDDAEGERRRRRRDAEGPRLLSDGASALFADATRDPALRYVDKNGRVKGEPTALDLATTKKGDSKYNLRGWNYAPTRAEKGRWQREWEKAERAKALKTPGYRPQSGIAIKSKIKDATFMPVKAFADLTDEEKAARRAADQVKYAKIKEDLLLTTAGMAGSGAVAAFAVGGANMGYSWLLGAAGAIVYVRLLSGKAESESVQGGPPSILVPVILFMALNRWNTLFAPDVGVALTPIPMLLAFFTYKPASVLQAFKDVLANPEDADDAE